MDRSAETSTLRDEETQAKEISEVPMEETDAQDSDVDQDITMAEVGNENQEPAALEVKDEIKSEVKLEDLFADIESDEEFPSSTGQVTKLPSSPEAPPSPM